MKINHHNCSFFIYLVFLFVMVLGNTKAVAQNTAFEKIYTHTDRSFYFPGETLWFKSYITEADLLPTRSSDVFYAELISPKGSVVKRLILPVNMGAGYGNFQISKAWAGGIYQLKVYTNWLKNYGEEAIFTKKITVQKVVKPNLLLKLKFQEEAYGPKSKVTALFDAETLTNKPLADYNLNYLVAARGKTMLKGKAITDEKGKAGIVFNLPDKLTTADVTFTVQLKYKGSTESISRGVPVVLKNINLQFMPESGSMLAGVKNTVAFKAVNEFGKPADVEGEITDAEGNRISGFKSFHDGMGALNLTPKPNAAYFARILKPYKSETKIKLPKAKNKGLSFSLKSTESATKQLIIYSSDAVEATLQIKSAAGEHYTKQLQLKKGKNKHTFSTKDLPVGIAKISLKTLGKIQAERLFFARENSFMNISVKLDKQQYQTREKTIVTVKTTDQNQQPIPANLSISVADNKLLTFANDKQDHILSQLLLSSELKGEIYKPVFYFDKKEPKAKKALDFVMLTHGWRNYIYKKPDETTFKLSKELESVYQGKVTTKKGKPVFAHLLLFDYDYSKVLRFDTDANGNFSFKGGKMSEGILIAYTDNGKSLNIELQYPKINSVANTFQLRTGTERRKEIEPIPEEIENPLNKKIKKEVSAVSAAKKGSAPTFALKEDSQALDEIVVIGYGTRTRGPLLGSSGSRPAFGSVAIITSQDFENILQGRTAGVQISNNEAISGNAVNIRIRGNSTLSGLNSNPLVIVDGIPLDKNKAGAISIISPEQVEDIRVFKGAAATLLYGSNAKEGVIVIKTRHQGFPLTKYWKSISGKKYKNYAFENLNTSLYKYKYSTINQFYMPVYEVKKSQPVNRTDFRQTVYWNPVVQTNEAGEATFEFYNNDAISSFKIVAEGINANGVPGRNETTYSTKKMLFATVKTPSYLAVNDTVTLDMKIENNSLKTQKINYTIELPFGLKMLSEDKGEITVAASGFANVPVTVVPTVKMEKEKIAISLQSENYKDYVSKEITVVSSYFPVQATIAGTKNKSYTFQVKNSVKGSVNAAFTIYTDVVGDVMDGIAAMLRQPYGCFEQTSSSTYPNVMILNYLREAGKSNPDIEAKALEYIHKGYKRLVSFETSENGFEWFGKTPPHETLTAFGLLEFTEMKKVYPKVDEAMIARTKEWLLSRRDGKGGFYKSKKGYDSFASSPKDVANAYIIYALSEAGIDANLELEYATALKDALKTKDTYKIALLACTAFNLKKEEDANLLIEKLITIIDKKGFAELPYKNTITRSYGNSGKVETAAFTVLALLKAKNKERYVQNGIEYILNARVNGRFGSTQATCMSLKALIEYTKNQKAKIVNNNNTITLSFNGQKISKKMEANSNGTISINNLEEYIIEGTQKITVSFSDPDNTFPYALEVNWDSFLPDSSDASKVQIQTNLVTQKASVGDNVRMQVNLSNQTSNPLPMAMGIVGIPSGLSLQPWQLKELVEQEKVAYYEIFGNHLVLYWRSMKAKETITIPLDLKAEVSGNYKAPASTGYLYYEDEKKHWIPGSTIVISQ